MKRAASMMFNKREISVLVKLNMLATEYTYQKTPKRKSVTNMKIENHSLRIEDTSKK